MTNRQITISHKDVGGPKCEKCTHLVTRKRDGKWQVSCDKGSQKYPEAKRCELFADASAQKWKTFTGGTLGILEG